MIVSDRRPNPVPAWCYASLWQGWLLGLLLFALFPELRAGSYRLGDGGFWFVVAPLASLAVLYRHALTNRRRATAFRYWHPPAAQSSRRGH